MATRTETRGHWLIPTRNFLKEKMNEAGVTYGGLAAMLSEHDYQMTESELTRLIEGGSYPAWFLLMCLNTIGLEIDVKRKAKR